MLHIANGILSLPPPPILFLDTMRYKRSYTDK
jgi:hypothetical protein